MAAYMANCIAVSRSGQGACAPMPSQLADPATLGLFVPSSSAGRSVCGLHRVRRRGVADEVARVGAARSENVDVDRVVDDEAVDLHDIALAVAADAADGLRVARVELLLRAHQQRVQKDAVIRRRQVGARRRLVALRARRRKAAL
eukprot:1835309-Pleurochrysis_carterae.AAC.5